MGVSLWPPMERSKCLMLFLQVQSITRALWHLFHVPTNTFQPGPQMLLSQGTEATGTQVSLQVLNAHALYCLRSPQVDFYVWQQMLLIHRPLLVIQAKLHSLLLRAERSAPFLNTKGPQPCRADRGLSKSCRCQGQSAFLRQRRVCCLPPCHGTGFVMVYL